MERGQFPPPPEPPKFSLVQQCELEKQELVRVHKLKIIEIEKASEARIQELMRRHQLEILLLQNAHQKEVEELMEQMPCEDCSEWCWWHQHLRLE